MKVWPIDVAIAAAGTVAIWVLFQMLFPSAPLTLGQTIFVLVVLYAIVKGVRWVHGQLSARTRKENKEQ